MYGTYIVISHDKRFVRIIIIIIHPSRPALGPHPASYSMGTASFRGRGVDYPSPSSAEVKERVELYIYSPLGLRSRANLIIIIIIIIIISTFLTLQQFRWFL
jgi:hypothetical protein